VVPLADAVADPRAVVVEAVHAAVADSAVLGAKGADDTASDADGIGQSVLQRLLVGERLILRVGREHAGLVVVFVEAAGAAGFGRDVAGVHVVGAKPASERKDREYPERNNRAVQVDVVGVPDEDDVERMDNNENLKPIAELGSKLALRTTMLMEFIN
jgi:hypothetical protein